MDEYFWTKRERLTSYLAFTQSGGTSSDADAAAGLSEERVWEGIHTYAQDEPYFYSDATWVDDRVTAEDVEQIKAVLDRLGISAWWDSPVARDDQQAVRLLGGIHRPLPFPPDGDPASDLRDWVHEAQTSGGDGTWWTPPLGRNVVMTSRSRPFAPAVALVGGEDELGYGRADVYSASPISPDARIYEIACGEDWLNLVRVAPADVTVSRVSNWGRFDRTARWYLPNWVELSAVYDAVHLTVNAYLDLSGIPQECPGGFTMITGWGADETYWLNAPAVVWNGPRRVARQGGIYWG
ncbi:hypothetical protein [Microbacterium mangrovi]|uniref:hypothetical protein n=1 Tax=Microbacterium mangrovi TaxID=1348253 RepID=UPI0012E05B1E|nr:hypothetical protein [Microbacterium mangrovi]